jgi:probable HAF family extracellular repeat protein
VKRSLVALAVAILSVQALAAAPSSYTIVDLGANRYPAAVNGAGTVAGGTALRNQPMVYANGQWTALPLEHNSGAANAVNATGVIVGWDLGKQVQWVNGVRKPLKGTHGGDTYDTPSGIADDGTIVGHQSPGGTATSTCYSWKKGVMTTLPDLGGGYCKANAIDPSGTYIAGQSSTSSGDYHAFLMDSMGMHDLGTPNRYSGLNAVNRHGHAVGWLQVDDAGNEGPAYWNGSQLVDLGAHVGDPYATANAINDADDVAITGNDGLGHLLFLFSAATQTLTPIEPLIANPAGWSFVNGGLNALAADGTIYGIGYLSGRLHGFKLVPAAN